MLDFSSLLEVIETDGEAVTEVATEKGVEAGTGREAEVGIVEEVERDVGVGIEETNTGDLHHEEKVDLQTGEEKEVQAKVRSHLQGNTSSTSYYMFSASFI